MNNIGPLFRSTSFNSIIYRGPEDPFSGIGVYAYVWYKYPYYSNNVFRTGILKLKEEIVNSMAISHDKIKVLNTDYESETRIYDIDAVFPAPYYNNKVYLQGINGTTETSSFYVVTLTDEPKGSLYQNEGSDYYYDNDSIYSLPSFTTTDTDVIDTEKYKLTTLICNKPEFNDTGELWKYGLVSAFTILKENYTYATKIIEDVMGYTASYLDTFIESSIPSSWRTKDIDDIYYELNDYIINTIKSKYNLSNFTKLDLVLYYISEIYGRLYG